MERPEELLLEGLITGVIATTAMSVYMEGWVHAEPQHDREPTPPRKVARGIAEKAGVWDDMPQSLQDAYVWLAHYGYGSLLGLAYSAVEERIDAAPALKGMAFGVAVWAAGYMGWLPVLHILKWADEKPPRSAVLEFTAHLVFGTALGLSKQALRAELRQEQDAPSREPSRAQLRRSNTA